MSLLGAIGSVAAGYLGYKGQKDANQKNLQIAREQMAFQERMSNTAYQRAALDMEKAGLNRILALGSPASTPGGQTAVMQSEEGAGLSQGLAAAATALAMKRQKQELKNMKATERKEVALRQLYSDQSLQTRQNTLNLNTQGAMLINDWGKQKWVMDAYRKNPRWVETEVGLQGGTARQLANIYEYLENKWNIKPNRN